MKKKWFFLMGAGVLSAAAMCFVIGKVNKPVAEKPDSNVLGEAERETVYYDFLTASTVSMIERSNLISDCELNVDFTDGEISGITLKLGMSSEDTGNGSLTAEGKNDILKYVSTVFDFPAESIVLSIM